MYLRQVFVTSLKYPDLLYEITVLCERNPKIVQRNEIVNRMYCGYLKICKK